MKYLRYFEVLVLQGIITMVINININAPPARSHARAHGALFQVATVMVATKDLNFRILSTAVVPVS